MRAFEFEFDVRKATQAAAIILAEIPAQTADYYPLLKLLYIADRRSLAQTGNLITGAAPVAMKQGPLPLEVYRCITAQRPDCGFWSKHIHRDGFKMSVAVDPGTSRLCPYEIGLLREVARRYGRLHPAQVGKITHGFAESKKNRVSSGMKFIPIKDILNAVGRRDQAEKIIQEASDRAAIKRLFRGNLR